MSFPAEQGPALGPCDSRSYNESMIKLILSQNLPILRSPTFPQTKIKSTPPPSDWAGPKLTLLDGFTNAAIASRFGKDGNRVAALVYCSAGMQGGQLSSSMGTHWAQEESTLVENPLIFTELTKTIREIHPQCAPTAYPLLKLKEIEKLSQAYTPAYGFFIDNVYPLQLNNTTIKHNPSPFYLEKEYPNEKTPSTPYISYIMQAALHFGLTYEDEATNLMFATNKHLIKLVSSLKTPAEKVKALASLRTAGIRAGNYFKPEMFTNDVPQEEKLNDSREAFNAFSTSNCYRLGPRYAIKALLFSDIPESDYSSPDKILQEYNTNWKEIEERYFEALKMQILTQILLTQVHQKNILIIGAFGCGVYNSNWKDIAKAYGQVLAVHGSHLKEVVVCNKLGEDNRQGMQLFIELVAKSLNDALSKSSKTK